jgi:hypothetical protein
MGRGRLVDVAITSGVNDRPCLAGSNADHDSPQRRQSADVLTQLRVADLPTRATQAGAGRSRVDRRRF